MAYDFVGRYEPAYESPTSEDTGILARVRQTAGRLRHLVSKPEKIDLHTPIPVISSQLIARIVEGIKLNEAARKGKESTIAKANEVNASVDAELKKIFNSGVGQQFVLAQAALVHAQANPQLRGAGDLTVASARLTKQFHEGLQNLKARNNQEFYNVQGLHIDQVHSGGGLARHIAGEFKILAHAPAGQPCYNDYLNKANEYHWRHMAGKDEKAVTAAPGHP